MFYFCHQPFISKKESNPSVLIKADSPPWSPLRVAASWTPGLFTATHVAWAPQTHLPTHQPKI